MPYAGHVLTTDALNAYAGPVVEQAVNQLVQVTPLEQVNERIHEITELVRGHLQDFLSIYGVMLNDVKVLIRPRDERMRELISLRAFGLSELDAVRYYVAMKMAERGLVSAPNMAVGLPFNIGLTGLPATVPGRQRHRRRARVAAGASDLSGRHHRRPAARPARVGRLHDEGQAARRRPARQGARRPQPGRRRRPGCATWPARGGPTGCRRRPGRSRSRRPR